jgi:hypothetical protein
MSNLNAGTSYNLLTSTNLLQWGTATTFTPTSTNYTWTVTPTDLPHAWFQLSQ